MIAIVDYGLGNIKAFANVYKRLDIEYCLASNPNDIENADKLILPGVGAFDHAMSTLSNSGLRNGLDEAVLEKKTPVLGICVGMQMMADSSEEGEKEGLGWVSGVVKRFDNDEVNNIYCPMPHMGWNSVHPNQDDRLFANFDNGMRLYFLHSFYIECKNSENSLAYSDYGIRFTSLIKKDSIYGVQCHPEKSHHNGVQLLKNFAEL